VNNGNGVHLVSRPKYTKRDKNHPKIVQDCLDLGMVVWDLADVGGEVLDIIVFWRGIAIPIEIKSKGNENSFTQDEEKSIEKLKNVGVNVVVATSIQDILEVYEASI